MTSRRHKTIEYVRTLLLEYRSPRQLALAVSLGIFIGSTPLWGLHTLLSIGLAFLFRLNKTAVVVASFLPSSWLAPVLIFSDLQAGSLILYRSPADLSLHEIRKAFASPDWHVMMHEYLAPYFLGAVAVAFFLAFVAYWVTLWIARAAEKRKEEDPA